MTDVLLDAVIDRVLAHEGGFVDHPNDRGGPTNFGLTGRFLKDVTFREWSYEDIRTMTRERAKSVYRLWAQIKRLDQLPEDLLLAWIIIDFAVHSGVRPAIRASQRACGVVPDDGIAGPDTQGAWQLLSAQDRKRVAAAVLAYRLEYLGAWLQQPGQAIFAKGVLRRLGDQVRACAA
jgi:lysozyme family protein